MRRYLLVAVMAALLPLASMRALAVPLDDDATCDITCTVAEIMEWAAAAFADITLADITSQAGQASGSAALVLYTNGNVDITADTDADAQLSEAGGDTLVTEYKLEYDGDGTGATGGSMADWTDYGAFLSGGSAVTHISKDGAVQVTLSARASNDAGNVADAADYSATQTLTASWQ